MRRLLIATLLLIAATARCQAACDSLMVMFYNVENLFDCQDDSLKDDDEFLPTAIRHWHVGRFKRKMADISRVIVNSGRGAIPAIVGLCEVENEYVMRYLTRYSPLKQLGYRHVMTDSPDERGIDVAIIYQRERFKPVATRSVRVDVSPAGASPTRDLLHCCGLVATGDTLDIIACHLPSRRGGSATAAKARRMVLDRLRSYADSLTAVRTSANIVIMGDFNTPAGDAMLAKAFDDGSYALLTAAYADSTEVGSYKYRALWQTYDHIIANRRLLEASGSLSITPARVVADAYLLTDDTKHLGRKPRRTYVGMRYAGGISDHLPVIATVRMRLEW